MKTRDTDREARLKQALKANMARRKAQRRGRIAEGGTTEEAALDYESAGGPDAENQEEQKQKDEQDHGLDTD